jgi:hypothetical protein
MTLEQAAHAAFTAKIMALPSYYQEQILGTSFHVMVEEAKKSAREAILSEMELIVPQLVSDEADTLDTGYRKVYYSVDPAIVASARRIASEIVSNRSVKRKPLPALSMWGISQEEDDY